MTKIPSYVCFFEPIVVAVLFSFTPEVEYFLFPTEKKYVGSMLVLSIIVWAACLFVVSLPLRELVPAKYNLEIAAQNYWLKRLKVRNSKADVFELVAKYKLPNLRQFIIPLIILIGGIAWLFYPMIMNKEYFYPYALLPIFFALSIVTTIIKYNNIEPNK